MDYKVKLQNNNNVFKGNNTDLQAVLETINNLPEAGVSENLDEEIATQEEKIASQDELIAGIAAALEGKAAGGGKTTKTINIEWCDYEYLGADSLFIKYISNNEITRLYNSDSFAFDVIEAEGGVVYMEYIVDSEHSSNVIELTSNVWVATQDNETIRVISRGEI